LSSYLAAEAPAVRHYDGVTRFLHWFMAAQIVTQFALALVWDHVGEDLGHRLVRAHVSLGVCLGATLVFRIVWRSLWGRSLAETLPPAQAAIARAMHWLLYTLMVVEVATGLSKRWVRGRPVDVFGLFHIPPPFGYATDLQPIISTTHSLLAWAIIIAALGHALVALFHRFVLRDHVFRRMTG
jgi:cytochrome b561